MNGKISIIAIVLASVFVFGSCKPKQSSYKSVYESAKDREMKDNETSSATAKPTTDKNANKGTVSKPAVKPTANKPTTYPASTEPVRKEKIKPVDVSDESGLKSYSIVIAAMGMKPNAESLKKRIETEGYKVILVQNEQGLYRVIIGSYDTRDQAAAEKSEILSNFMWKDDQAALQSKFGIPFDDWWILQRDI